MVFHHSQKLYCRPMLLLTFLFPFPPILFVFKVKFPLNLIIKNKDYANYRPSFLSNSQKVFIVQFHGVS